MKKNLPVGFEDYKDIIDGNFYYVDKTMLIRELRDLGGKVNLFLRPRRFGKTLTLSMVKYFYEDTGDSKQNKEHQSLFNDKKIMDAPVEYRKNMTAFPVISLTLKSAKQGNFNESFSALKEAISNEFDRHKTMYQNLVNDSVKLKWKRLTEKKGRKGDYNTSLLFLSKCLHEVYGKRVIILIDEYDVPLESAYFYGYYDTMVKFIRTLFESALKTNPFLEFAVITGCLRISRESIFTGMNNLLMASVLDHYFDEHYGFTQNEMDDMLRYYERESRREDIRHWYNGYRIGKHNVYNPWSAVNSVRDIIKVENFVLKPFWANTSSNDIIKIAIEKSRPSDRTDLECLLAGNSIKKPIHEDITYADLTRSGDNLWNFMLFTGYLTAVSVWQEENGDIWAELVIPNKEVENIYRNKIREWFSDFIKQKDLSEFFKALVSGDALTVEKYLRDLIKETISYHDYAENYYHGILTGIFSVSQTHTVRSNRESGLGRPDIVLIPSSIREILVIIEIKVSKSAMDLEKDAQDALSQIEANDYESEYRTEGFKSFVHYGIAFYKKDAVARSQRSEARGQKLEIRSQKPEARS